VASIIIEERTGNAGTDRKLELMGAGLPFQGANWAGALVVETTFPAGNPEGTQHVFGPQELPSSWEGEWNTTRLIKTASKYSDPENGLQEQNIVSANALRVLLEDIYRGGALLRVTFATQDNVKIVRLGRATEWDFKVIRGTDIKWTTTFEWLGRGDVPQANANFAANDILANTRSANLAAARVAGLALVDQLAEDRAELAENALANQAPELTLEGLTALATAPLEVLDRVGARFLRYEQRLVHLGSELRRTATTLANYDTALSERAADIGDGMQATAAELDRQMTQQPPEVLVEKSNVGTILVVMNHMNGTYEATTAAGAAGSTLALSSRRMRSAYKPQALSRNNAHRLLARDTISVYVPKSDDTMVGISLKFYGTDTHAGSLARVNGLPAETITPPRAAMVIPILAAIQQQSVRAY
jgi:hypothetical protein